MYVGRSINQVERIAPTHTSVKIRWTMAQNMKAPQCAGPTHKLLLKAQHLSTASPYIKPSMAAHITSSASADCCSSFFIRQFSFTIFIFRTKLCATAEQSANSAALTVTAAMAATAKLKPEVSFEIPFLFYIAHFFFIKLLNCHTHTKKSCLGA